MPQNDGICFIMKGLLGSTRPSALAASDGKSATISLPAIQIFSKNPVLALKSTFKGTTAIITFGAKTCRILSFFLILF